jgi:FkbM family methyltransferase
MIFFKNDDPIGACLSYYGEWAQQELDLLSTILSPESVVFDVGANIGTHTIPFSLMCEKGIVFCFEPQLFIFNILVTNVTINQRFNVIPVHAGLSNKSSKIRMRQLNPFSDHPKVNYGEHKLNNDSTSGLWTDIYTLDKYIDSVPRLDLIKLDVETMEVKVLEGGKSLIDKFKPALYIEFSEKNGNDKLLEKLDEMNYDCFLHVYDKHNQNNFNKKTQNVWEEDSFILTKENMHKRFDASILCMHREKQITSNLPKMKLGDSLFSFLFEKGII